MKPSIYGLQRAELEAWFLEEISGQSSVGMVISKTGRKF